MSALRQGNHMSSELAKPLAVSLPASPCLALSLPPPRPTRETDSTTRMTCRICRLLICTAVAPLTVTQSCLHSGHADLCLFAPGMSPLTREQTLT